MSVSGSAKKKLRMGALRSSFQQESSGISDEVLDLHEELHGLAAIDDSMIVGQRDVHHRANHRLSVDRNHPVLDFVETENADLRWIEDRRAHERPEDAAV